MRRPRWPAYPVLLFALTATHPAFAEEVDLDDLKPVVVPPVERPVAASRPVGAKSPPPASSAKLPRGLRGSDGASITASTSQAASEVSVATDRAAVPVSLYLEVYINGQPRNWIAEFRHVADGFLAQAKELREIGLQPPENAGPEDWIALSQLPNASVRYEANLQRIHINVADTGMTLTRYGDTTDKEALPLKGGPGAYLNYTLSGGLSHDNRHGNTQLDGLSAAVEGWAFNDYGVAHSSFLATAPLSGSAGHVRRLDTFLRRDDVGRQMSFQLGDAISGGLSWTRPIRLGGVQIRRNFDTRPDLIRQPLPSFRGSAAVPSTVDVVAGNVTLSSTRVEPGRFEIANISAPLRQGVLDVVVRGEGGAETRYQLPFSSTENLLRPGLTDFSVEAGFARRGFGTTEDTYLETPLLVASLRRGLTDRLTAAGHLEADENLINGGIGIVASLGRLGTLNGAVAASASNGREGTLLNVGYGVTAGRLSLSVNTRRRFGHYLDLADVTAIDFTDTGASLIGSPERFDSISASYYAPTGGWSVGAGYAFTKTGSNQAHLGTFTFAKRLSDRAHFSARAQSGLDDFSDMSVFAGLTMQLGERHSASAGLTATEDNWLATSSIAKSAGGNVGETGYQATLRSDGEAHSGAGQVTHALQFADLRGGFSASKDRARLSGEARGSLALVGGTVHAGRRIDSAFAVVDAGAADVTIRHQNRIVGKTGESGRLLVTQLSGFDEGQVSVDAQDLPLGSAITKTRRKLRVARNKGAMVAFDGATDRRWRVTISLVDQVGKFLPVGTPVRLASGGEESIIGYDGETFIAVPAGKRRFTLEAGGLNCAIDLANAEERQRLFFVEKASCL